MREDYFRGVSYDEEWRIVDEFPYCEVSNYGNVWNLVKDEPVRQSFARGYKVVSLRYPNGIFKTCSVHRLVAIAFLGDQSPLEVNHMDLDKTNNHLENLEWMTHKENMQHYLASKRELVW